MIAPRPGRIARAILTTAAALAGGFGAGACLADAPPSALATALRATAATGRPTVVVVTSASSPSSKALLPSMLGLKMGAEMARSATFVEADVEEARRAGVAAAPGLAAVRRVGGKVESTRYESAPRDAYDAVGWLYSLGLAAGGPATAADPGLVRAGHFGHDVQPSPQGAAPPQYMTPAPPQVTAPVQQFVGVPSAPVVASQPVQPVVVSTPSQPIVFQQSAPTVYVAPPAQPANIVLLSPAPSAPSVSVISPVSMVQQPQQQLFLAAPAPAAAAQPVQMVAAAPAAVQPVQMVAAAPAAVQPVQAVAPAAVQAQPVAASQVEAIAPGPIGRLVGNFGERLAKHKQPRLRVASPRLTTTTLLTQSSNVTLATVPVAAAAPQQAVTYAPAQQAQPVLQLQPRYDPAPQQPVASPSPQGYGPR